MLFYFLVPQNILHAMLIHHPSIFDSLVVDSVLALVTNLYNRKYENMLYHVSCSFRRFIFVHFEILPELMAFFSAVCNLNISFLSCFEFLAISKLGALGLRIGFHDF